MRENKALKLSGTDTLKAPLSSLVYLFALTLLFQKRLAATYFLEQIIVNGEFFALHFLQFDQMLGDRVHSRNQLTT